MNWPYDITLGEMLDYMNMTLAEFEEEYDWMIPPEPVDASFK